MDKQIGVQSQVSKSWPSMASPSIKPKFFRCEGEKSFRYTRWTQNKCFRKLISREAGVKENFQREKRDGNDLCGLRLLLAHISRPTLLFANKPFIIRDLIFGC